MPPQLTVKTWRQSYGNRAQDSSDYDAKERKIRRPAVPEIDNDATNKRYVELALNAKGFLMLYSNIEKVDNAKDKLIQDLQKTVKELEEKSTSEQLFETMIKSLRRDIDGIKRGDKVKPARRH
ncbi:unnamed protein product [Lasius platythorax]|uniref:Uncharacterized protein n=1 Tax=Lasius platythorax TaxID=488582 RepID=A0AAV2MWK5_9HYME